MSQRHLSAAVAARQRSPSPDYNPSSDPVTQRLRERQSRQMEILIPYRKLANSVVCRDFKNDGDVEIPQTAFVTAANFKSMTPGFAIYRQKFAQVLNGVRVAVATHTIPEALAEGFGSASNVGRTAVIFTVDSVRYHAPLWAFPACDVSSRVSISVEDYADCHFIALPPVSFDASIRKSKQSPMPLIIKVHRKTGGCSTKSDPRHWDDDAVETSSEA